MSRKKKRRTGYGTIVQHRGFWCRRFRERVREGDTLKTIQRNMRLAPVDAEHKTRKSVKPIVQKLAEGSKKVPSSYVGILLGDFTEGTYFPCVEPRRKPSTVRGYKQMWNRYLKPRSNCTSLVLHNTQTHMIQALLHEVDREEKLPPQTMAHIKHFLSGVFRYAIRQGHVPAGTINPVTSAELRPSPISMAGR